LDISNYLQRGLFVSGPVTTKRQFLNLFGQQLVPGIAVEASAVVAASIGVVAGASWPDRTRRLLVVAPGFDLSDVVRNVAQQVRTGLQATGPVPQDLWAVPNVDKKSLEGWVTLVGAGILCGGAFFRGAAWGLSEPSADKVAESWVAGVNSDWSVAAESGLAVDRPTSDGGIRCLAPNGGRTSQRIRAGNTVSTSCGNDAEAGSSRTLALRIFQARTSLPTSEMTYWGDTILAASLGRSFGELNW